MQGMIFHLNGQTKFAYDFVPSVQIPRILQKLRRTKPGECDDCPSRDNHGIMGISDTTHQWILLFTSKPSTHSTTFAQTTIQTSAIKDATRYCQIIRRMLQDQTHLKMQSTSSWKSTSKQHMKVDPILWGQNQSVSTFHKLYSCIFFNSI